MGDKHSLSVQCEICQLKTTLSDNVSEKQLLMSASVVMGTLMLNDAISNTFTLGYI